MSSTSFSTTYEMAVSKIENSLTQVLSQYGINGATFDSVTQTFVTNGTGIDGFFDAYPLTVPNTNSIALGNLGNYLLQLQIPTTKGETYTLSGTATTTQGSSSTSGTSNSNGSGSSSGQTDATSCFNSKYLQNGNTINLVYGSTDSQGNSSTITETHSISGPTNFNGQSAWQDQETESGINSASTTNYLIDQNNQSGIYSAVMGGYTTTYSPYNGFIDFTTKLGQSYEYNLSYTSNGNAVPMAQTVTTTFNGMKSVQVPAGNFNVCEFTANYAYQNSALSAENYQVVLDIAVGSGFNVQTETTSSQGTTTLKLISGSINGTAISP
jgi:hypothetical protein